MNKMSKLKEDGTTTIGKQTFADLFTPVPPPPQAVGASGVSRTSALRRKEQVQNQLTTKVNLLKQQREKQQNLNRMMEESVARTVQLMAEHAELEAQLLLQLKRMPRTLQNWHRGMYPRLWYMQSPKRHYLQHLSNVTIRLDLFR